MEAALHGHDGTAAQSADDEVALMAYGRGCHEVGYVAVGDDEWGGNHVAELTEAAAEHDDGLRHLFAGLADAACKVLCCFFIVHNYGANHLSFSFSICICISAARS